VTGGIGDGRGASVVTDGDGADNGEGLVTFFEGGGGGGGAAAAVTPT